MSLLFSRDAKTIRKHINNVLKEEIDQESNTHFLRVANSDKPVLFYSLDVIISVGYRVKSKEGIIFRKWANKILKQYMLKGYVVDIQRFDIPSIENITKLLEQARKASGNLQLTSDDMLDFLLAYNKGLTILDKYDHQTMEVENSLDSIYVLNYEECIRVIDETAFVDKGDLFGLEKSDSFKSAI